MPPPLFGKKKLFIYSFALTSALVLVSASNVIDSIVNTGTADGLPYQGISSVIIPAVIVIALPPLIFLLKQGYIPVSLGLTKKEDASMALFSLFIFIVSAAWLGFANYDLLTTPKALTMWFAQILIIFLIYAFFFKMLSLSHGRLVAEQNSINLNNQLKILNEQHLRFNDSIENSRRMRHDLKHHMLTIHGFINNNRTDKALEYMDEYIKVSEEYEMPKLCDIPVINWILSYYQMLARENDIEFEMRISTPPLKDIEINDADLSVLLGNLLENAVTGAALAPDENRKISLNIIHSGKMLVITVDNTFNGIVNIGNETSTSRYLSTKSDHTGIGITSIESIAEKYSGGAEFTNTASVFHASVMLNISPTSK